MQVIVQNLQQVLQKLAQLNQALNDTSEPMRQATLVVAGAAKRNAPVDTGVLRASIMPHVENWNNETTGVVGSNQISALMMELGTRPFWPPLTALEVWARRHGTTAYVVARAISRRGLKARRFLQRALEDNQEKIIRLFNEYVKKVIR